MVIVSDDDDDSGLVEAQLFERIKDMDNTPLVGKWFDRGFNPCCFFFIYSEASLLICKKC